MPKPTNDPAPVQDPPPATGAVDWKAEAEKWQALARKHEDRAKSNHDKVQELETAQASTKSDMDKVLEKLAAMEETATKAQRDALIATVSKKTGLSEAKVARLNGSTADELIADAGEMFDWKPKAEGEGGEGAQQTPPANQPPTGRPPEKLTPDPGGSGGPPVEETNPLKLAEKIPRL